MDQFDFDDLQDQPPKKSNNKKQQNKQLQKKNNRNKNDEDFYDLQIQDKPKPKHSKLNNLSDDYFDSETDTKTKSKKNQNQNKQNESILPKININKSPRNSEQKSVIKKMDLSLQQLPQKKVYIGQNERKTKRKQQQEFQFKVNEQKQQSLPKSQLKTTFSPIKQKVIQMQNTLKKSQPQKKINKVDSIESTNKAKIEISKKVKQVEQDQQDYQDEYEEQIYEEQIAEQNNKSLKKIQKQQQKSSNKAVKQTVNNKSPIQSNQQKNDSKNIKKIQTLSKQSQSKEKKKYVATEKIQTSEQKISKYKQLVEKSFPNDQDEQKVQKLKPDSINRLNDKMREMIKGFSKELTEMIDKNLVLLRKPQNQIKEQIEAETDPIQAEIKLLQQMKKNNQKVLENTEKQLEAVNKTSQKVSSSAQSNAQMTEQIETYKKQIAIISRENSNLQNDVEKQGKKVTKLQQNGKPGASEEFTNSKFKSALEITQKLASHRLQFDKNKKKLSQLQQKLTGLEDKITEISKKRNKILQRAQHEGITFHTKEQKKRYDELRKKRDQYQVFESKFKSSIKSKQAVIQHEMTDIQVVIAEYEKRYQLLDQQAGSSKQRIFAQIKRAKKNPRLQQNTRQILTQLQQFMSDDNVNRTQQDQNALNLISQNIYKKEYQSKGHSKTLNDEKAEKRIQYKNYLQQVSRQNQQARKKSKTDRKVSQQNPFRKAVTPSQSAQVSHTLQKMNKTKQPQVENDIQKQRVWKSSNTQVLLRNPLKRQSDKNNRYSEIKQEQNPLQNKEIMNLINKNKEKITLKQQQKSKQQNQSSSSALVNKKPFTMRTNAKQQSQQLNELAGISKQMQKIQKQIESHRSSLKRETTKQDNGEKAEHQNVQVKLKDHPYQQQISLQPTVQLKPAANTTPFRNLRLKKQKDNLNQNNESSFKLQSQQPSQQKYQLKAVLTVKEEIKQQVTLVTEDSSPFKPKRFALRKRNQNQNQSQSYIPSAKNIESTIPINNNQKTQISRDISLNINMNDNKIKKNETVIEYKLTENTKKDQSFDPFKKFMINQKNDEKTIQMIPSKQKQQLTIDENKGNQISYKPKINLFKKGTQQPQNEKKLILLGDSNKEQKITSQKVINPYAQINNEKQPQVPKFQRQGKLKRMNPPANSTKPVNKNIYADVQDATLNTNIKMLGDPQPTKKEPQIYVPKSINQDKQLNVNDLLGIKKKNYQVDKQLLIDLPGNNKISFKSKVKGKGNDFFDDLEL